MSDIVVNIKGLEEIKKTFGTMPIRQALNNAIKKTTIRLQAESIKEAPVDRGQLRSSFVTNFSDLKGVLSNQKEYALYVHEGTSPHAAPFDAIKQRAARKGLPRFPVRLSIKMKGTKANPFFNRAVDTVDPEVDDIFNSEMDALFTKYGLT